MTSQQEADQLLAQYREGKLNDNSATSKSLGPLPSIVPDRETHRASRIEMYADWLAHDADGLAYNLTLPRIATCTGSMLSAARSKLVCALELIDNAIAVDRAATAAEQENVDA